MKKMNIHRISNSQYQKNRNSTDWASLSRRAKSLIIYNEPVKGKIRLAENSTSLSGILYDVNQKTPYEKRLINPFSNVRPKSQTPSQQAKRESIEQQCKRIDPLFQLRYFLKDEFPLTVQKRQQQLVMNSTERRKIDSEMVLTLDLQKRSISSSRSKIFRPHNQIIRRLKRIYQNKLPGQTELSTLANEFKIQKDDLYLQNLKNEKQNLLLPFQLRQERWKNVQKKQLPFTNLDFFDGPVQDISSQSGRLLQIQDVNQVSSNNEQQLNDAIEFIADTKVEDLNISDLSEVKIEFIDKKDNFLFLKEEQDRVKNEVLRLKLEKSPLFQIINKFPNLIEHQYNDFNIDMRQIVDFYSKQQFYDQPLDTHESIYQVYVQKQKARQKDQKNINSCTKKQVPEENNITERFCKLDQEIVDVDKNIKINIRQIEEVQKIDLFSSVQKEFHKQIGKVNL